MSFRYAKSMSKFVIFFGYLVFFLTPVFGMQLKEKISLSSPGDYTVICHKNTYTLLHLHSKDGEEVIFEEISIASHQVDKNCMDWKKWVSQYAPGHTSWILYSVDLEHNAVTECFSFNRHLHLKPDKIDKIFTKLLNLNLKVMPIEQQLQRSSVQKAGQVHKQKPWAPRQYVEGKRVPNPSYEVLTAVWPADGTELAGKHLVLYFDRKRPHFPFPYWIQARSGALKFKMHAVDSGKNLSSPQKNLPRRLPAFHAELKRENDALTFTLQAPYYYKKLQLYAIDTTVSPRTTHLIPSKMTRDKETVTLSVDEAILAAHLTAKHRYLWLAVAENHRHYAEYPHLFTYIVLLVERHPKSVI